LRFSLLTMTLLMLAALVIMPSNSLGDSARAVGAPRKSHHQRPSAILTGKATYYPNVLSGHKTASGETFRLTGHTAASNRLPLGTDVTVTNLKNGRSTQVKVNDRGPALGNHRIDLSKKPANQIGLTRKEGTAPVTIEVMRQPANRTGRTSPSSATNSTEALH
jgi:rare lipoprotein A